jgi:flagellar hook assembly protein FlgD
VPTRTALFPPAPNPFNPVTTIRFTVAQHSHVNLRIYDVKGRLVRTLINEVLPNSEHRRTWDGRDNRGNQVASGVYFARLQAGPVVQTRKMVLLK